MGDLNNHVFEWDGPLGLPQFERIGDNDFAAAMNEAIARHTAEIAAIADNREPPDFDNTIIAMETSGDELERASALLWNRAGAHSGLLL